MATLPRGRVLVTGAVGQIGSELTLELRRRCGADRVIAGVHRSPPQGELRDSGPCEAVDVCRPETLVSVIDRYGVDTVYHMAAILSAIGEQNPQAAWNVNMIGLHNVLEVARARGIRQVFAPSSIAVFGPETPRDRTPQETILRPTTMYGVTKVAGELLAAYYVRRYGLDVRGVRYPGIISSETLPGGGTTDYAVAIYYEAVANGRYTCFVREDTVLPMMYMPDCIAATIALMEADGDKLVHHTDFNLAAMSFSAGELAAEIRKHLPGFTCTFAPDHRQAIADSWPRSIDDTAARQEWGWQPTYNLSRMTEDMLRVLALRHAQGRLYPAQA